jgi:hypothetical protein
MRLPRPQLGDYVVLAPTWAIDISTPLESVAL